MLGHEYTHTTDEPGAVSAYHLPPDYYVARIAHALARGVPPSDAAAQFLADAGCTPELLETPPHA